MSYDGCPHPSRVVYERVGFFIDKDSSSKYLRNSILPIWLGFAASRHKYCQHAKHVY